MHQKGVKEKIYVIVGKYTYTTICWDYTFVIRIKIGVFERSDFRMEIIVSAFVITSKYFQKTLINALISFGAKYFTLFYINVLNYFKLSRLYVYINFK